MVAERFAFSIREYGAGDAPAIADLFHQSVRALGPRAYSPDQVAAWSPAPLEPEAWHARATDGRTTLVAVNDTDEVVAFGDLERDGHIDLLYCRPDAAGHGVASRLLDELLARATTAGMPRLYVEASELARPVFERKGFTVTQRRDFAVRGVAIHNYAMERLLS